MKSNFSKLFKKEKNIIIGAIHLPPLLGYIDYPGYENVLKQVLLDLDAFVKAGVDGVIFENNYDTPHKIFAEPSTVSIMTLVGKEIKKNTNLPVGINVLWNDYKSSLSIAKTLDLQFIRIPVFVDDVKTSYGIVNGSPTSIISYKESIKAEGICLFTDIHVKHSVLLSKHSLVDSAMLAIENGTDAIIITGNWTGQSPNLENLETVRKAVSQFPILIGSGINNSNIKEFFKYANGTIVSTSLKEGVNNSKEINLKSWHQRISEEKVRELVNSIN